MRSPRWIAPIVTWLASAESKDVTGRVFEASGNVLAIAEGWVRGPRQNPIEDPSALGPVVHELLAGGHNQSDSASVEAQQSLIDHGSIADCGREVGFAVARLPHRDRQRFARQHR